MSENKSSGVKSRVIYSAGVKCRMSLACVLCLSNMHISVLKTLLTYICILFTYNMFQEIVLSIASTTVYAQGPLIGT